MNTIHSLLSNDNFYLAVNVSVWSLCFLIYIILDNAFEQKKRDLNQRQIESTADHLLFLRLDRTLTHPRTDDDFRHMLQVCANLRILKEDMVRIGALPIANLIDDEIQKIKETYQRAKDYKINNAA